MATLYRLARFYRRGGADWLPALRRAWATYQRR